MYDYMTMTEDWLAGSSMSMADLYSYVMPSFNNYLASRPNQKAIVLQHTLLVGVTVLGALLRTGTPVARAFAARELHVL
jgi:glutathione S-transferase